MTEKTEKQALYRALKRKALGETVTETQEDVPDELDAAIRLHVKRVYEKYEHNLTRTAAALKSARNTVKKYLED